MPTWQYAPEKAIHICQKDEWIWNFLLLHLNTRKVLIAKCSRLKHQAEKNQNISSPWLQVQIPHTCDIILYILQTASKICKCVGGWRRGTQTQRKLGIRNFFFFERSELGPEWGKQTTNAQNLRSVALKVCASFTFIPRTQLASPWSWPCERKMITQFLQQSGRGSS